MEWKNLSNEAKSVIEWIENPFTGERETIEIKIGEVFQRKFPSVNILVTKELYQEILRFVTEDDNIQCEQFMDNLLFRLKETVKLH